MESVEKETKLDEQHIEFLTSRDTLKSQVGLSLKLRTLEFKKRFATKRICTTSLRNLYRKHKIKRKKIKVTKLVNPNLQRKINR